MTDYISREAASLVLEEYGKKAVFAYTDLIRAMAKIPAADVVERKHGKWVDATTLDNEFMYEELVKSLRAQADYYCCHMGINSPPAMMFVEAADAIEELNARSRILEKLAELWCERVPKWIPVTERLPKDGAEVLAFNKTGFAYVDCWADGKWKINSMVDEEHEIVTHWMPLPEPPKDGAE